MRFRTVRPVSGMVDAETVGLVLLLLLAQGIVLYFLLRPRKPKGAKNAPAPLLVIPDGLRLTGRVEVRGDVTIAAGAARPEGEGVEMDVPTEHVDDVLKAFQKVGFEARDTGLTVDTDEGEETLTTLRLDLGSMTQQIHRAGSAGTLVVDGDLTVEPSARVECNLKAFGAVRVGDEAVLRGDVRSDGDVHLGNRVRVDGDLQAARDVEVGADSRARSIRSRGEVRLAQGFPGMERMVQAARVTVRSDSERRGQGV